jgi:hypothetical protein
MSDARPDGTNVDPADRLSAFVWTSKLARVDRRCPLLFPVPPLSPLSLLVRVGGGDWLTDRTAMGAEGRSANGSLAFKKKKNEAIEKQKRFEKKNEKVH